MPPRDWDDLTEGARRIVRRAQSLAAGADATATDPTHLLDALLQEESQASQWLETAGVRGESSPESAPLPEAMTHPLDGTFTSILFEARVEAARLGRGRSVNTVHLLWGLLTVPSTTREVLLQSGLSPDQLANELRSENSSEREASLPAVLEWDAPADEPLPIDIVAVSRILDAAANRAREGLRTVEDYARFVTDDRFLSASLKTLRHALSVATATLPANSLIQSRETQQDVGTAIQTEAEYRRSSPLAVAVAAMKRVQEAFRTLEEFGKVLDASFARQIEQLRYEAYTLEKQLRTGETARQRLQDAPIYLLLTQAACPLGWEPLLKVALGAGVRIVQVREKGLTDRQLIEHARAVRAITRPFGALLIINDRPDIAAMVDADGVHVGQDECTVRDARQIVGPDRLIGVSTHHLEQARQAVRDGADYLGVGPTFPSGTKTFSEFAGLEYIRQVAAEITRPWYAIGGITTENLWEVVGSGATRIAVSGVICGSLEPVKVIQALTEELRV